MNNVLSSRQTDELRDDLEQGQMLDHVELLMEVAELLCCMDQGCWPTCRLIYNMR